jgi:hypothetical protein
VDDEDDHPASTVLELHALLNRLLVHPRVWSLAVRAPCSFFDRSRFKMQHRSAKMYVRAAAAAAPDIPEQCRLLVEQCKMLEENGLSFKYVRALDSVEMEYPENPLAVLTALHAHYPQAGPPLDRTTLSHWDDELSEWQTAVSQAEDKAQQLEQHDHDAESVQLARTEADELRATLPRSFTQCMNKSRMYFHSDKRGHDLDTSTEDKTLQFSQVNDAWEYLTKCRTYFQELRAYQTKVNAQPNEQIIIE